MTKSILAESCWPSFCVLAWFVIDMMWTIFVIQLINISSYRPHQVKICLDDSRKRVGSDNPAPYSFGLCPLSIDNTKSNDYVNGQVRSR